MSRRNPVTGEKLAFAASLAMLAFATPAVAQHMVVTGATVHTMAGDVIENGAVLIDDGLITAVGAGLTITSEYEVVDAAGLHVYPGMFNAFSRLGLQEINSIQVTNDHMEVGDFNPNVAAATAVHPASERIPVTRANGVTHAVAAPSARSGGIGGQASVIALDGWTIEEMQIGGSVGMVLSWPALSAQTCSPFGCFGPVRPWATVESEYEESVDRIRAWLDDARRYGVARQGEERPSRDLRLEALGSVTSGDMPFLVLADGAREIRDIVMFGEEEGVRVIIVSGGHAPDVAGLLAEHDVPVLLRATQNVPSGDDDPYAETFTAAVTLHEAGVRFAMTGWASAGPNPPSRTLPYEAANAVGFGLPAEAALAAITSAPAEILGLGDRLGTIEAGKIANLIVTDGDPLQIRTQMVYVIINGAVSSPENKHKALWERYRARR
jgi:imidazolonepropionase-like amidohydrolase